MEELEGNRELSLQQQKDVLVLVEMSEIFKTNEGALKFVVLRRLAEIFLNNEVLITEAPTRFWKTRDKAIDTLKSNVGEAILQLLSNKLPSDARNQCFLLLSSCLSLFGPEWALGLGEKSGQFVLLMVHLVSVELRVLLFGICPTKVSDVQQLSTKEKEGECLISVCYKLLETTLQYLTLDGESELTAWSTIPSDLLLSLQKTLNDTFLTIFEYVEAIADCGKGKGKERNPQDYVLDQSSPHDRILIGTLRIIGVWLSEETESLVDRAVALFPFLFSLRLPQDDVPFSFLLPGLLHITAEPSHHNQFLESGGIKRLYEFISALLVTVEPLNETHIQALTSCLGIVLNLLFLGEDQNSSSLLSFLPLLYYLQHSIVNQPFTKESTSRLLEHVMLSAFILLSRHTQESVENILEEKKALSPACSHPSLPVMLKAFMELLFSFSSVTLKKALSPSLPSQRRVLNDLSFADPSEFWGIAMNAFSKVISSYPTMHDVAAKSEFFQKLLDNVFNPELSEEERSSLLLVSVEFIN